MMEYDEYDQRNDYDRAQEMEYKDDWDDNEPPKPATGYERVRAWRQRNPEKYRDQQKELMRKRRGSP
jgi:hypothetical protein